MTIDIDKLTGTESLEELEALLATVENGDDNSGSADTEEKGVEQPASPAAESEQASSESQTDDQVNGNTEQSQEEGEKYVSSKDGAHKIPYAVLEHERAESKRLREENETLRQAAAERDQLRAKLEKEGISLTDDQIADLTPEQLAELTEDYPGVAPVIKVLTSKLAALEAKSAQPATPATNPIEAAIAAVPDLLAWKDADADRFTFAVTVDEHLKSDPAWKDKPLSERFAEAAKRTRAAFGDAAPVTEQPSKPAGKEPPSAKPRIPDSPSDLGGFNPASGRLTAEALEALPQEELMARMATMSSAQIEELLSQADY
jgi:hypothetical protein